MTLSDLTELLKNRINAKEAILDDENDSFIRISLAVDYDKDENEGIVIDNLDDITRDVWEEAKNNCREQTFENEYEVNSWGEKDNKFLNYKVTDRDWDWGNEGEAYINIYLERI